MPKTKGFTLIYKQLVKWFIKVVWPWIVKNIWPVLQQKIIEIFVRVATTYQEKVDEWFENRNRAKADAAQTKAEEAETKANAASSDTEAEKLRAVAEVWRQIAEQFRQENEVLKAKLGDITRESASDFRTAIDDLDVENLVEEGEDTSLRLKGSQTVIKLPSPAAK